MVSSLYQMIEDYRDNNFSLAKENLVLQRKLEDMDKQIAKVKKPLDKAEKAVKKLKKMDKFQDKKMEKCEKKMKKK